MRCLTVIPGRAGSTALACLVPGHESVGHVLAAPAASVVAKAWDHADRIGRRSAAWTARTALVTGAGPIGLLAALMGRQRGLDVHVYDRVVNGPKPGLVADLGCTYHGGEAPSMNVLAPELARADRGWLARLITRRVALADWVHALTRRPGDVKVVLDFESAS